MDKRIKEIKRMWHEDGDIDDKAFYWLIQQAERVELLERENKALNDILTTLEKQDIIKLLDQNVRLIKQNKRYREALEFYADKENYKLEHFDPNLDDYMSTVDYDEGIKARKALEVNENE